MTIIAALAVGTLLIGISFLIGYLGMKADPKQGMSYIAGGMMMKMVLGSALSVGLALYIPDFDIVLFGLIMSVFLGVGIPAVAVYVTRKAG
jgi:ACR3 family arsenite efflux pump ArsB